MYGIDYVLDRTLAHLAAAVPVEVAQLVEALDLDLDDPEQHLAAPDPRDYHYGPPDPSTEHYPAVFVEERDTVRVRMDEPGGVDGRARFTTRYRLRVFVYARGNAEHETRRRRNRLTVATRRALISRPTLGTARGEGALRVDVDSTRESYSGVDADGSGGLLAAAYVECDVDVDERLSFGGDPAERFDLTADPLPRHPALD